MQDIIKNQRKKLGLSQEAMAKKINISWRQYQRIESKTAIPKLPTFLKIIEVLQLDNDKAIELLKSYK